ncbi:UNVERIFIED_CONTAM: hypothetical protein GTU68_025812 [Idotea baltica]|nr:hypothetical protein [Idotea baltica]
MKWICKHFDALSLEELYQIGRLRQIVFVVEQDCPYIDHDNRDQQSHHFWTANSAGLPVAYCRIVPPGISYNEASIGRIITAPEVRKEGYGKVMMTEAIQQTLNLYENGAIRISAQCYLEKFYSSFNFEPTGKEYLEDGIPHMEMLRA